MMIRTTNAATAAQDIANAYRTVEGDRLPPEVIAALNPLDEIRLDDGHTLLIERARTEDRESILIGVYCLIETDTVRALRSWTLTRDARLVLDPDP